MQRIYVVSKISHAPMWRGLRDRTGLPIVSTWIDDGEEAGMNFAEAWPRYLREAASATHVIVYTLLNETLKGGLFEIGAALGGGARVLIVGGEIPQMRTLVHHPEIRTVGTLAEALLIVRDEAKIVGRPGERDPDAACADFQLVPRIGAIDLRGCEGDGHYLCRKCTNFKENFEE